MVTTSESSKTSYRRLLLLSDSYPPLTGGATLATRQLALGLRDRGWSVQVVTSWQRGAAASELLDGIRVVRVRAIASRLPGVSSDPHRYTPPPIPDPGLMAGIRRSIRKFEPSLIHSYGWITYSVLPVIPRRMPLVVSARDYGYICPKRTLVKAGRPCPGPDLRSCLSCAPELYGRSKATVAVGGVLGQRRWLASRVDKLHSCSSFVADLMAANLMGSTQSVDLNVIPDFRPETESEPAGAALQPFRDRLPAQPYILYVGALRKVKGIDVLLAAYRRLPSDRPPLVLIGSQAPDTPPIGSDVTVLHDWPYPAVMEAWRRCLFGVSPSILPEPLGNVVHECQSQGKAMIGTFPGGHAEMIQNGVTGLLVPGGSVGQLAEAMSTLLTDTEYRVRLGQAARETAAEFTAARCLPRFEQLYLDALSGTERIGL